MKLLLCRTILCSLLLGFGSSSAWAQGRIATIDLRKVFDGYWKTKQADASLKDRAADMEKEHKNMLDDWKKAKDDYQGLLAGANDQAVSNDEREKRKKNAEDKLKYLKDTEDSILQYEKQARTTLEEQKRRMKENILGEIRIILNSKAKSAGYSFVIDTAAESFNNTPVVLFSSNENDLTEAILTQMNSSAPAESPKVEEKKDEKKTDEKKNDEKKTGKK
jgi:Skp family chaperone for outer membrane proteins